MATHYIIRYDPRSQLYDVWKDSPDQPVPYHVRNFGADKLQAEDYCKAEQPDWLVMHRTSDRCLDD